MSVVVAAHGLRGTLVAPDDDRVPDPMGGPSEAHQLSTALIFEALRTILDVLAASPSPPPHAPPPRVPLPVQTPHPVQPSRGR